MQRSCFLIILLTGLLVACGPKKDDDGDASVSADASGLDGGQQDGYVLPDSYVPDAYVPGCGNGTVDTDEECDDGNRVSGDGCNASCTRANDDYDAVAAQFSEGDQLVPRITTAGTAILMGWEDWGVAESDGAGARVRSFTEDGVPQSLPAVGSTTDFPANTTSTADQYGVAMAGHSDGRFVVAWTDTSNAAGGGTDVRAMMFDGDGNRLANPQSGTSDFVVHTTTTGTQQQPAVSISDQGLILIAWSDDSATGGDTSGWAVRGRLFDFAGAPQVNLETSSTDDFLINATPGGNQYRPSLVANGAAGWALVWVDDTNRDGNSTGIVGTLLGAYGDHSLGADVLINSTTTGAQSDPIIALQPAVGYVVCWTDDSRGADDPYFRGIRGRSFDLGLAPRPNGVTMTSDDFPVNTLVDGSQQAPGLAVDPANGNVIIVWQDGSASDGSWAGIRGRAFNAGLSPLVNDLATDGSDFKINTTASEAQLSPAVTIAGGQAVALWEDHSGAPPDASGVAIRYRILPPLW